MVRTPSVISSMLRAVERLTPLYVYNDALIEHIADPGSLHYYMNKGLLARFKVGGHSVCVEEASNYTNAVNSYGFFNSDSSWTTMRFVAYYDNYAINPLNVDFKYYNDVEVRAYSSYSSSRFGNLIFEPEAFDIIKSELVTRLAKLRRFGLLFDTMVESGFELVGFNGLYNFFLFDGIPFGVYLLHNSATFQFESYCVIDGRKPVAPRSSPEIILGDIQDHLSPAAVPMLSSKKVIDVVDGSFSTIWGDKYKIAPDQRRWLRMHGSISKAAILNRLSDIVAQHAINVKYGSSPSWY